MIPPSRHVGLVTFVEWRLSHGGRNQGTDVDGTRSTPATSSVRDRREPYLERVHEFLPRQRHAGGTDSRFRPEHAAHTDSRLGIDSVDAPGGDELLHGQATHER